MPASLFGGLAGIGAMFDPFVSDQGRSRCLRERIRAQSMMDRHAELAAMGLQASIGKLSSPQSQYWAKRGYEVGSIIKPTDPHKDAAEKDLCIWLGIELRYLYDKDNPFGVTI